MTATTGFEADYATVTEGVGLLDRSERGKLALTGKDAKEFLQGQVTQDITGARARARRVRRVPHAEGQDARRPAGARYGPTHP